MVVFNFPEGDTVVTDPPDETATYYSLYRESMQKPDTGVYHLEFKQVDMRENYVKRCMALPGDTLMILHGYAYINGNLELHLPGRQFNYFITSPEGRIDSLLIRNYNISSYDIEFNPYNSIYELPLTQESFEELLNEPMVKGLRRYENASSTLTNLQIFPSDQRFYWTEDNFGSLIVPSAGTTITLSDENLPLYRRIITVYENNSLEIRNGLYYINGHQTSTYTFCMNYYFMMGDNRHNSNDSRYWGFVPEDHIIGKAWLVLFATDNSGNSLGKIRWNQMFKKIK